MFVDTLPVGPLLTNAYLVTCRITRQAVLIDPGWNDPSLFEAVARREARVMAIINTHAHWDHIGGNAALSQHTGAPIFIHRADLPLLQHKGGVDLWQIPLPPSPQPARFLSPDEIVEVGKLRFRVLFTPGHTPGHISLYEENNKALFDGDVLFRQGIGRSDLPGGNSQALMRSIRETLMTLPDDVTVYPGHGPATTIGDERRGNPWLA